MKGILFLDENKGPLGLGGHIRVERGWCIYHKNTRCHVRYVFCQYDNDEDPETVKIVPCDESCHLASKIADLPEYVVNVLLTAN